MLHEWRTLASVLRRDDPSDVQRLLPPGFRVDAFDDAAWVAILPFPKHRIGVPAPSTPNRRARTGGEPAWTS
jgi:uncharacterized protein YqjF (DUF2071 family)